MINLFVGRYNFLSNFCVCPVVVDGITYKSAEHAFQAHKAMTPDNQKLIMDSSTPARARGVGRLIPPRPDWESIKDDVMYKVVKAKFEDPELCRLLLDTGNEMLVEGNYWHDTYWGVDAVSGEGHNKLGHILMRVRHEARQ